MSMQVRITVSGDSIINMRPEGWEIVAITDQNHIANISINGGSPLNVSLRNPNRQRDITFRPHRAVEHNTVPGNLWNDLLNISSPQMHDRNPRTGQSNLRGGWRRTGRSEIVRMVIPVGLAEVIGTVPDYWIRTANPLGPIHLRGHATATGVRFTFNLQQGNGVDIDVADGGGPHGHNIPFVDNTTVDVFVNNHCGGTSHRIDDFLRYYEWMEDQRPNGGNEIKFICGKHDGVTPLPLDFDELFKMQDYADFKRTEDGIDEKLDVGLAKLLRDNMMGNCDPVGSDPPLWP